MIAPGGRLTGRLPVPGDKSISHRALILAALAEGVTRIDGFLDSADCRATLTALQTLGITIELGSDASVTVHGGGTSELRAPAQPLDCGNSGTSMRLLAGMLAGQPFSATLSGDDSLRRRPMERVVKPLQRMGARIESLDGCAPLTVHGRQPLKPLRYALPVASAQVKSALLLAGLFAEGETWLREPAATRDHTERMLTAFGGECLQVEGWIGIRGGNRLRATPIQVPGDLSSAAFFLVGAAIATHAHLVLEDVGVNPTRTGIISLLRAMGADIRFHGEHLRGVEPVADIEVRASQLHGIHINPENVPLAIDELPVLLVAAACADGVTTLRGAAELRVKESDRLQSMATGLRMLGVGVETWEDGMQVTGSGTFTGGTVDAAGDHRIAMAFAMAGLRATAPIHIRDCRNVDTSFPGFARTARAAGLAIDSVEDAP
ncbi:MAG: 3-phosphoshikimate 1-carboxyvinyltransferase [Gammaproteobacteria bacterium]|nr:3-phosphoshikimate 1-carboxyvinyltransferase [Gammaproteobacteria bacterium]